MLLVWNAGWRRPAWSLPGGEREPAEPLTQAAVREVYEETGLEVEIRALLDVHERIGLGGHLHLVVFTFLGDVVGGSLIDDGSCDPDCTGVSAAKWTPIQDALNNPLLSRVLTGFLNEPEPAASPPSVTGVCCTSELHSIRMERIARAG